MDSSLPNLDRPNYFRPNDIKATFALSLKIAEHGNLTVAAGPQFRNSLTLALAPSFTAIEPRGVLVGILTMDPPAIDVMDSGSWSLLRNYFTMPVVPVFTESQAARTTNPLCYMVNTPGALFARALYMAPKIALANKTDMSGFARGTWVTAIPIHATPGLAPKLAALTLVKQSLTLATMPAFNATVARYLHLAITLAAVPRLATATLPETFHLTLVLRLSPGIDPSLAGPELVFDSLVALPDDSSAPPPWLVFYPGNTQGLRLEGLYEPERDLFVSNATLVATLQDAEGTPVWGLNDVAMLYVKGTPATYQAAIDGNEFAPAPGNYSLVLLGDKNGSTLKLVVPAVVESRVR
jgi:hypothetical protein